MHSEAMEWVAAHATDDPVAVLDIGGRDNNGSPRSLFPKADPYVVLDIERGPDVDIEADAATWQPDREYDVVICTEVFEHTPRWPAICATARRALRPGGQLVATMAGPGRPPHGAWGAPTPGPGEYYDNVDPELLRRVLVQLGFTDIYIDVRRAPADVRVAAARPG